MATANEAGINEKAILIITAAEKASKSYIIHMIIQVVNSLIVSMNWQNIHRYVCQKQC